LSPFDPAKGEEMSLIAVSRCHPVVREQKVQIEASVGRTENGFEIRAALPGVEKEKISVVVDKGRLVIRASRAPAFTPDREIRRELAAGEMAKEFYLPDSIDMDAVASRYENGVLSVTLPLRQQAGPRAVSIE